MTMTMFFRKIIDQHQSVFDSRNPSHDGSDRLRERLDSLTKPKLTLAKLRSAGRVSLHPKKIRMLLEIIFCSDLRNNFGEVIALKDRVTAGIESSNLTFLG